MSCKVHASKLLNFYNTPDINQNLTLLANPLKPSSFFFSILSSDDERVINRIISDIASINTRNDPGIMGVNKRKRSFRCIQDDV
jgi:hypothetical protein